MTYYRLSTLDLSTRITVAVQLIAPIPQRPWGYVTQMAREYGVSRTWLYELRDRAVEAVGEALVPHRPGPQPEEGHLTMDRSFIQRAIPTLALLKGTVRGIQEGLDLLFGVHRSVGHIDETLQQAGQVAAEMNAAVSFPTAVLAEADEIFQGKQPCLTVVDGRSFVLLNLSAEQTRDATSWGVTFLDLAQQGISFHNLISDGARGITAGVKEAQLAIPLGLDLFHLLREAHKVSQRLERKAYRAMEVAEKARRADAEAQSPCRRRGRPLTVPVACEQAEADEQMAIETHDLFGWLVSEVRVAFEPITAFGRLTDVAQAKATIEIAAAFMAELPDCKVKHFAQQVVTQLSALLAPLSWLEAHLAPYRTGLDREMERLILWGWKHQETLALSAGEGFPEALQPIVRLFWEALELFHRTSSLAECVHSWLRPYLMTHRGSPKWLLALLQLYWNHREFQRGERAGKSPLALAGVEDVPSLKAALERLVSSEPISQAA